jgi:LPS O-antigen subunit length determinant protein (WzzB/FepE family)
VFDLIKTTQAQIVAPYIEEAKVKLADDEERLQNAKDLVARPYKLFSPMSENYFLTRDEIRYLLDEITALKNVVTSNQNRVTRMVAPIYASDAPIAPKKRMVLAAGLFGGLFLGLLLALARQMVLKLKSASGGVL